MNRRPDFIQVPTLKQQCVVFNLIRKGREICSKGELTPEDAVDLREMINAAEREFELSFANDDDKPDPEFERDLDVLRQHFNREGPNHAE
jgi:hypothetical protein